MGSWSLGPGWHLTGDAGLAPELLGGEEEVSMTPFGQQRVHQDESTCKPEQDKVLISRHHFS